MTPDENPIAFYTRMIEQASLQRLRPECTNREARAALAGMIIEWSLFTAWNSFHREMIAYASRMILEMVYRFYEVDLGLMADMLEKHWIDVAWLYPILGSLRNDGRIKSGIFHGVEQFYSPDRKERKLRDYDEEDAEYDFEQAKKEAWDTGRLLDVAPVKRSKNR